MLPQGGILDTLFTEASQCVTAVDATGKPSESNWETPGDCKASGKVVMAFLASASGNILGGSQ